MTLIPLLSLERSLPAKQLNNILHDCQHLYHNSLAPSFSTNRYQPTKNLESRQKSQSSIESKKSNFHHRGPWNSRSEIIDKSHTSILWPCTRIPSHANKETANAETSVDARDGICPAIVTIAVNDDDGQESDDQREMDREQEREEEIESLPRGPRVVEDASGLRWAGTFTLEERDNAVFVEEEVCEDDDHHYRSLKWDLGR